MPRPRFLLGTILLAGSALRGRLVAGVGAMAPGHRKLIAVSEREKIGDSLDLDEASREEFPGANRWDYLLSVPAHSEIIGVEPHSANTTVSIKLEDSWDTLTASTYVQPRDRPRPAVSRVC